MEFSLFALLTTENSSDRLLAGAVRITIVLFLYCFSGSLFADEIRVAVASNFKPAMECLVEVFETRTGHDVLVSYGATGKHYAQIVNGAPFDLFLAADTERPRLLEEGGHAIAGSRFTYAVGSLLLYATNAGPDRDGFAYLKDGNFRFLAIANPRTAPYGSAAAQFLDGLGIREELQSKLVRGENIAQVFAYVHSGNAEAGLIAQSQQGQVPNHSKVLLWPVPRDLYQPIDQQGVLLKSSPAAIAFLDFLRGQDAASVITQYGYSMP